jgi:predicted metal-binding protein
MSPTEKNLESLCQLAKALGVIDAAAFQADGVVVDERVRLKCQVPVCDDYGLNLKCPPTVMRVQEFREALAKYTWAVLIQIHAPISAAMRVEIDHASDVAGLYKSPKFMESYRESFIPAQQKLHRIVHKIEAQAFTLGYRFAVGFIGGTCKLCSQCVASSDSQEPCRHPYLARPSMEAVGIDVFATAKNAGLPFEIPAKDNTVWNGLVLVT